MTRHLKTWTAIGRNPMILSLLLITTLQMSGQFVVFTYMGPLLARLTGVVAGVVRLRGVVVVAVGLLAGLVAGLVEGRLVLPPIVPPPVMPPASCCASATLPVVSRNTIADRLMN